MSYIYRMGTAPNTHAAVSQKNKIYGYMVDAKSFQQIGAVSEFGFDESRSIEPIRGVGFGDTIAELVPGVTEPMTLTLNKTLLYTANLFQVLGYKGGVDGLVRSLRHHRWPFDVKQELVISELAGSPAQKDRAPTAAQNAQQNSSAPDVYSSPIRALFTFFEGCWMNSYSASFTSDAAAVLENSSVTVSDVIDGTSIYGEFITSGLSPATAGAAGNGSSIRFNGGTQATNTGLI